jgi:MFS family permease
MVNKNIKLLSWFNFFTEFRPYGAIAVIYFAHVTGSYALALAVYSVSYISSSIFEVPTGLLSDIVGRKGTIVFGAFFSTLSIVFYALSGSFAVLAIGATLEGLAQSLFSGNNEALLFDTLKETNNEKSFPEWFGKTSSLFQVALGISAFIGGFIANWSLSFVMWVSVIPQALGFLVTLFLSEPTVHGSEKNSNIFSHLNEAIKRFKESYSLRLLSIGSIWDYSVNETAFQFLPAFYQTLWPLWAIGVVRSLSYAGSAMSYWLSGSLIKRFNAFRILIAGQIYSRIVGIIGSLYPTVISPILISSSALFKGVNHTASKTLIQQRFTDQQRATMGSLNAFVSGIIFAVFAYLLGKFADVHGPAAAILLANILVLPNIVLYWFAYKKLQTKN